jgi:DNA polymerase-3 subunit epsilon
MNRIVAFDVETAEHGHIVEFGCVEIINNIITGKTLHGYVRPIVRVNPYALAVHGITDYFLRDKPRFSQLLPDLLNFIGDAQILAHSESVERVNLEKELGRLGRSGFPKDRFICSYKLVRQRGGLESYKLRNACESLGINNGHLPELHDALRDAEMAARLYLKIQEEKTQKSLF